MRYLLPIVPLSREDRALLEAGVPGARLYSAACALLCAQPGARALVFTTLPQAARELALAHPGLAVVCGPEAAFAATQQEATALALRTLLDGAQGYCALDPAEPVVAVDPRNPGLKSESLARALALADGDLCAASFEPVHDHPAQQFVPCRLAGLDVLAFLDDESPATGVTSTRPFFFDWRGQDVWDEDRAAYALDLPRRNPVPRLLRCADADSGTLRHLEAGRAAFLREGPFAARRLLVPHSGAGESPCMVPAYWPDSALPVRVLRDADGGLRAVRTVRADAPAARRAPWALRYWSLRGGAPGPRRDAVSDGERGCALDAQALVGADGILAALLLPAEDAAYDFRVAVPCDTLWAVDPDSGRTVSAQSGQPFCNRQELPPLHQRDDALLAGRAAELLRACLEPETAWRAFALPPAEAVKIRTRLDLLLAVDAGLLPPALADGGACPAPPEELAEDPLAASAESAHGPLPCLLHGSLPGLDPLTAPAPPSVDSEPDFAALRHALAVHAWRHEQLYSLAGLAPKAVSADPLLEWFTLGRQHPLTRSLPDALAVREIAHTGGQPCAAPARGLLSPLPGLRLPCRPHLLTSDGAATLFVCARPEPGQPQLLRHDLATGQSMPFGAPEARYAGVWFDRAEGRLCALRRPGASTNPAGPADPAGPDGPDNLHALDFFSPGGVFLHSAPLPPALSQGPQTIRLFGNAHSYFCASLDCQVLFEIDKRTLALTDVRDSRAIRRMRTYCVAEGELLVTGFYSSTLTRHPLDGGPETHTLGPATLFALLVDHDPATGHTLLVTRENFPADRSPVRAWLRVLDRGGECLESVSLEPGFYVALHVLADRREALVAEDNGGVLRFGLGGARG